MEFGRKGIELLREIVNHDHDSLSAYNVSPSPPCNSRYNGFQPRHRSRTHAHAQEDLVRTIVAEVHDHDALALRITQ